MTEDQNIKNDHCNCEGKDGQKHSYSSDQKIQALEQELERAKKQAEEYLDGWKRAKADYINLKKETEKRQKELIEFASVGLLLELFPLVDQFKQAFRHLPQDLEKSEWIVGVRHIQTNLKKILTDSGIEEILTVGEKFNPEFHEAVEEIESEQEKGTIVEEIRTGFKIGEKVVQPAKVKVAKQKSIEKGGEKKDEAN